MRLLAIIAVMLSVSVVPNKATGDEVPVEPKPKLDLDIEEARRALDECADKAEKLADSSETLAAGMTSAFIVGFLSGAILLYSTTKDRK